MTSTKPATAPKSTPATPESKRNPAPVVDYSALQAADVEMPKGSRGTALDGTPFVAWMTDSADRSVAKSITIPVSAEKQTVYLLRQAADRIGRGVRIVTTEKGGNVTVTFQAKDRRRNLTDAERAERKAEADRKRAERAAAKAAKAAK